MRRCKCLKISLKFSGRTRIYPPLFVKRTDSDSKQTKKGTVQHEVLSSQKEISDFMDDEKITIPVQCTGQTLMDKIPYGLAVTLETEEDINIYTDIKEALQVKIKERIFVDS